MKVIGGQEDEKYNARVNCLVPSSVTQMSENVMTPDLLQRLAPEPVSPAVVFLASDEAPNRAIKVAQEDEVGA